MTAANIMYVRALDQPKSDLLAERVTEKGRLTTLREYGNFALAYSANFQPGLNYFGGEEGFLAYKQVGSTAFVLSDPIAPIGGCEDLIRRFTGERSDVCFWQASRPVAKILEKIGFRVNEMGTETRIELDRYDFDGPRKRNFRKALKCAASCGYTIAERPVTSLDREELQMVSDRWRQTRGVKTVRSFRTTGTAFSQSVLNSSKKAECETAAR